MEVFTTKYALSGGIQKLEVEECGNGMVKTMTTYPTFYHGEGRDWHRTRESAVRRAEEMRKKKIESLKKSIAKLEKANF